MGIRRKFPTYRQLDRMDCGPTCVKIVAEHFGMSFSREEIRQKADLQKSGVSFQGLTNALKTCGIGSIAIIAEFPELVKELPLPLVAHWQGNHFVVVHKVTPRKIHLSDPALGLVAYPHREFQKHWAPEGKGVALLLEKQTHVESQGEPIGNKGLAFLWAYLAPLKTYLGHWVLALLLGFFIQMALPFLTQAIVDRGIAYHDIGFVQTVVIAYAFLWTIRWATELLRDWFTLYLSAQIQVQMTTDFLARLLQVPMTYFDTKTTGDFIQRIHDHEHIDAFLGDRSLLIVFDILTVAAFGAILSILDMVIGGIFVLGTLVFLGWSLLFLRRKERLEHHLFQNQRKGQSLLVQLLTTMVDIKVNGSQERRIMEWRANQHGLFQLEAKGLRLEQAQRKGGRFVLEALYLLVLLVSAQKVLIGELTLGSLLAIQFIMGSLHQPIAHIVDFLVGWQRARLSLERLAEIHTRQGEGQMPLVTKPIGDLKAMELSFSYGKADHAPILKDIDFEIPFGSSVALVGPSGCGKTSLLKLMLKLYEPTSGSLYVGEDSLMHLDGDSWREQCGAVLQDSKLFNDTLERNITESGSMQTTDILRLKKAIRESQLTDFLHGLPLGMKTNLGENGQLLSGGERQRVLLARALYRNPTYLFLDEATSALDGENEKHIMENLMRSRKSRTLIIAAHRLSTVREVDKILVMDRGKIVEQGTHLELLQNQGLYAQLILNQL